MSPQPHPTFDDYCDQARRNYSLVQRLLTLNDHLDWAITALFYTSIHMVQALAVTSVISVPHGHKASIRFLINHKPGISTQFKRLYDASLMARYYCYNPSRHEVNLFLTNDFTDIQAALAAHSIFVR